MYFVTRFVFQEIPFLNTEASVSPFSSSTSVATPDPEH